MIKLLFLFSFLIVSSLSFSQYNDTLYYKSGQVKNCTINKYDDHYLHYEYRGKRDKLVVNRISISILKYFVIYNEFNEIIYNSATGIRKEEGVIYR